LAVTRLFRLFRLFRFFRFFRFFVLVKGTASWRHPPSGRCRAFLAPSVLSDCCLIAARSPPHR